MVSRFDVRPEAAIAFLTISPRATGGMCEAGCMTLHRRPLRIGNACIPTLALIRRADRRRACMTHRCGRAVCRRLTCDAPRPQRLLRLAGRPGVCSQRPHHVDPPRLAERGEPPAEVGPARHCRRVELPADVFLLHRLRRDRRRRPLRTVRNTRSLRGASCSTRSWSMPRRRQVREGVFVRELEGDGDRVTGGNRQDRLHRSRIRPDRRRRGRHELARGACRRPNTTRSRGSRAPTSPTGTMCLRTAWRSTSAGGIRLPHQ